MRYIIELCDICGASDKPQNRQPEVKLIRNPGRPSITVRCCEDCVAKVNEHNKPYDDADRKADEEAKAVMDAKVAAKKQEEEAKKNQEGKVMEMLVQQNQVMMQLLAQLVEQNANAAKPRRNRKSGQEMQPQG
ncbi:MAG TPA: hypothetical protein V6D22_16930 [Candidatus Obscuribacterales bacterium]